MYYIKEKTGSAILDYVIMLGIIATALIAMNTYMKRGVQRQVKEMSDFFISEGPEVQVGNASKFVTTDSQMNSSYTGDITDNEFTGGGRTTLFVDSTEAIATTTSVDIGGSKNRGSGDGSEFVPAERGFIKVPERPSEEEFQSEAEKGWDEEYDNQNSTNSNTSTNTNSNN